MSYKSARLKAGRSVPEVAAHLHVSEGAVYQWENGISAPTVAKLKKLATYYDCTTDELLKEETA